MSDKPFDPSRHLINLKGKEYLEVKWRLVWVRDQYPETVIETECLESTERMSRFKATVTLPNGARATGHGCETPQGFPDHYEKAETIAVGRALAMLGYGTQFAPDMDEGPRIVDSPVQRRPDAQAQRPQPVRAMPAQNGERPVPSSTALISEKQNRFMWGLAGDKGWDEELVHTYILAEYHVASVNDLTRADASAFIDHLQSAKPTEQRPIGQEPQKGYQQGYAVPEEPAWVRGDAGDDAYSQ